MSNYRPELAWISSATADTALRERAFLRSVYGWMCGGLLTTAFAATWVIFSPAMQQLVIQSPLRWVLFFVELGLVLFLSARINRISAGAAAAAFLVFSLLNGFTLSVIFFFYTTAALTQAFATAAGMFGAMSLYGFVTKRDLTSWGAFFMMGLFGLILCSLINIFLRSNEFAWLMSFIGVFVFLGLTAYDTQKMKILARSGAGENLAIIGALNLYLDFINLFLFLLRIFGGRRR